MCPAARKTDVREEYYSAIKKNEIMPCAATWTDLEIIILSEVGQIKTSYGITYLQNLKKKNQSPLSPRDAKTSIIIAGPKSIQ